MTPQAALTTDQKTLPPPRLISIIAVTCLLLLLLPLSRSRTRTLAVSWWCIAAHRIAALRLSQPGAQLQVRPSQHTHTHTPPPNNPRSPTLVALHHGCCLSHPPVCLSACFPACAHKYPACSSLLRDTSDCPGANLTLPELVMATRIHARLFPPQR